MTLLNHQSETFLKILKVQKIDDIQAGEYVVNYLQTPEYLISLFVEGFSDEEQVSLYDKFFGIKIDDALKMLAREDSNMDILAADLAEALKKSIKLSGKPSISLLNKIWSSKVSDNDLYNPYVTIVLFSLCKTSIEDMISDSLISLSETVLTLIFDACGFKNENGVYALDKVSAASDDKLSQHGMQEVNFDNLNIKNFSKEKIIKIVNSWISKVECDLSSKSKDVFNQVKLISVFYRYIQWGLAIENDNRQKLENFIIEYLKDDKILERDKKHLKAVINHEREKYESKYWKLEQDPMDFLFNNNAKLLELIK